MMTMMMTTRNVPAVTVHNCGYCRLKKTDKKEGNDKSARWVNESDESICHYMAAFNHHLTIWCLAASQQA
jgi:hypothetical protein